MTLKIPISDLLAHRDGEHMDPALSAEIEADAESREHLKALREIKHALNELPGIDPADEVWRNIDQHLQPGRRPRRDGRPWFAEKLEFFGLTGRSPWANVATAATVFFAAALSILWWNPGNDGLTGVPATPLSAVVLRSQQLESRVFYPQARRRAAVGQVAWNSSQQALMYRIADVDAALNSDDQDLLPDPAERDRLWRQRVALLESLLEVQRRPEPSLRTALY